MEKKRRREEIIEAGGDAGFNRQRRSRERKNREKRKEKKCLHVFEKLHLKTVTKNNTKQKIYETVT